MGTFLYIQQNYQILRRKRNKCPTLNKNVGKQEKGFSGR